MKMTYAPMSDANLEDDDESKVSIGGTLVNNKYALFLPFSNTFS